MDIGADKKKAIESVDSMAELYKDISDYIYDNPELSLKEFKAAEKYIYELEKQGFTVERNLSGIKTAFSGSFGSGRPYIGILGEFDALSGIGHGCGHNLLGAASFAAAVAVKQFLENTGCTGTVIFYGCPGEEGGSGKAYMAKDGVWKNLDAALCWHPSDVNQIKTGTNNSCIQILYKFNGVSSHAAGDPENGRSALDAVELMNIGVQFLREHMAGDCRIHYAITDAGGISPNVVQNHAEVLYMTRANKVRDCIALQKRVDDIADGAALMTGTSYERVFIDGLAELLPNFTLERLLYRNFKEVGLPEYTQKELEEASRLKGTFPEMSSVPGIAPNFDAAAAEEVREKSCGYTKPIADFLYPMYSGNCFIPGSTDVGDVSWQTPTSQIETAAWPFGCPAHSWQAVACGKTSFAQKAMLCAAKVLAGTAIDLMTDDTVLEEAKKEFLEKSASGYVCPIEDGAVPVAI